MKRIIIMLVMGLLTWSGTTFGHGVVPSPASGDGLVVNLKFIFHRPKMDCQKGFGICMMVSVNWEDLKSVDREAACLAKATVNEKNQLVVSITEDDLKAYEGGAALAYFRDQSSIPIPDPYVLPVGTCQSLGIKPPQTIQPGDYPVSFQNGVYTVIFQL